ncbi:MAG TPA: hypothetical protein VHY20_11315 [Pirellulales bacterium]|nr:hypothetical protein [Pirellulales bacterium]
MSTATGQEREHMLCEPGAGMQPAASPATGADFHAGHIMPIAALV